MYIHYKRVSCLKRRSIHVFSLLKRIWNEINIYAESGTLFVMECDFVDVTLTCKGNSFPFL
jgi:predicted urease superfamily metal-dependent hydrolase